MRPPSGPAAPVQIARFPAERNDPSGNASIEPIQDPKEHERAAAVRRTREDWLNQWADYHTAQQEERDYALKLDHYRDSVSDPKQLDRIRPRGRQLYGNIRHKSGQISRSEIFLELRPGDESAQDAAAAEAAKWAIEWVLHHPLNDYETMRDLMVQDALAARVGCLSIYYDETIGTEGGEICIEQDDPGDIMWELPYHSPHHPQCRRMMRTKRMRLSVVKGQNRWKNVELLKADSDQRGAKINREANEALRGSSAFPGPRDSNEDGYVTILFDWQKNVSSTMRAEAEGTLKELKPGERYMECVGMDGEGCGSPPSETEAEAGEGIEFPEHIQGGCAACGGDMARTDATVSEYVWEENNSLGIYAVEQGVELYYGPWPFPMRTFPEIVFTCNTHPHEPMGQSETSLNMSLQTASNMILRLGLEYMSLARPYWAVPRGTQDYAGKPWVFGRTQGLAMYFDPLLPPNSMPTPLQASGLPASWATLNDAVESPLRQDFGSNDVSAPQDQTRNIPVGTIQAMERLGEIPVDHQIDRLRRAEAPGFGVILDLIRATWTADRIVRMRGDDGQWVVQAILGATLPDYDVYVSADPSVARIRTEALQNLKMVADSPPWQYEFLAEGLNIPMSQVRKLQSASQDWQAFMGFMQQQQAMEQAMQNGGPPEGPPPGFDQFGPPDNGGPPGPPPLFAVGQ